MKQTNKSKNYEKLKLKNQLCFPLYAVSRQIVNLYTPVLKPFGITYTQYIVFMVLWEEDGITMSELGKRLYLNNGTLTPLIKKLEQDGYITRERSHEDERIVRLFLTDKGHEFRDKLIDVPTEVGACVSLNKEDAAALYKILYSLLDNFENRVGRI